MWAESSSFRIRWLFLVCSWIAQAGPQIFGDDSIPAWHGVWRGTLEIWGPDQVQKSVEMELHIVPRAPAEWDWKIVYGAGENRQERPYRLRHTERGYEIDEQNGIVLPLQKFGDRFFSRFDVQETELLTSYELLPDGVLRFEVMSGPVDGRGTTGGTAQSPPVTTGTVAAFQRATLKRQP